ncbi:hypothetical protein OHA72_39950 [Dactylosporangium sp. NBC_01737]|uniref:hypothetical protein n=1 Tax=Dactylosporangium sp. NBC_01737 TaxID=2975959 RepID=UPI002E1217FE|nr:hypothetical protein OHA72_39950 [Dactylosporangium sp. NBC_01737]
MSGTLLTLVVRLLPAGHRDWGRAMLAETAAVPPGRERWTHALGCVGAVLSLPPVLRAIGYPLVALAVLAAVLQWSAGIAYGPLRWGVVGIIALLQVVALWGRRAGVLGPVGDGRTARAVRAGGCLFVAAATATFAAAAGTHGPPQEQARFGVPIFAVFLTSYLVGFLAVTARRTAVTGRALAVGVAAAFAATGIWLVLQFAFPPLPTNVGGAVFTIGCGVAAVTVVLSRADRWRDTLLAALCASMLAPLLVFTAVVLTSSYGPARLIPDLVPAALTPADDLANSRIEIQDPYVAMLFLACLAALVLTVASATAGRARRTGL